MEDVNYRQEQPSCPTPDDPRTVSGSTETQTPSAKGALFTVEKVMPHEVAQNRGGEVAPVSETPNNLAQTGLQDQKQMDVNTIQARASQAEDCPDTPTQRMIAMEMSNAPASSRDGSSFTAEGHPIFYDNGQKRKGRRSGTDQSFLSKATPRRGRLYLIKRQIHIL